VTLAEDRIDAKPLTFEANWLKPVHGMSIDSDFCILGDVNVTAEDGKAIVTWTTAPRLASRLL
jgi:hypothetical protein